MKLFSKLLNKIRGFFRPKATPKKRKTILDFRSNTQNNFRKAMSRFLIDVHHVNSDTKEYLKIVDPKQLKNFIAAIAKSHLAIHYKLIICLQAGAGGRINEILNLKKEDIDLTKNLIRIKVLKKRTKKIVYRFAAISEEIQPLLNKYLVHLEEDNLFNIGRHSVFKFYKKMLGICTHALRHSFVSYLVEVEKWTPQQVQKFIMFEDIKDALVYYNTNTADQAQTINL